MPSLSFVTLDVFTKDRYAGNPLAVVKLPADQDLSTEQMQTIAREFNLSETIFIHDSPANAENREWKVRIFLVKAEIPFAGHPTIGCAVHALGTLAGNAKRGRFLAGAGPIELTFEDEVACASIPHNFHQHQQYPFKLEDILKLQPQLQGAFDKRPSLRGTELVNVVSPVLGMNFVTVELPTLQSLRTITTSSRPSPRLDDDWNVGFTGSYFYVITSARFEAGRNDVYEIQTRMIEGALEDPATGSAACALSCFIALNRRQRDDDNSRVVQFDIIQGVEMGRKSEIGVIVTLNTNRDAIEKVELSGSAIKVMEGVVEY